ncbi:hypothetical protein CsSME_00024274 [Camellia sinensis var. sinensis]
MLYINISICILIIAMSNSFHIIPGNIEDCKEIFRTLYSFIYLLGTYLKPHMPDIMALFGKGFLAKIVNQDKIG